jgi:hypothetical protein
MTLFVLISSSWYGSALASDSLDTGNTYCYQPCIVTLEGLLTKSPQRIKFDDRKLGDFYLIKLRSSINIIPNTAGKDTANTDEFHDVKELQVAFDPSKIKKSVIDGYLGQNVVVEGFLYEQEASTQQTPVLIFLQKIRAVIPKR